MFPGWEPEQEQEQDSPKVEDSSQVFKNINIDHKRVHWCFYLRLLNKVASLLGSTSKVTDTLAEENFYSLAEPLSVLKCAMQPNIP